MNAVLQFIRHFFESALRKEKRDWEVIFYCILVSGLFWILNAMGKIYHHTVQVPVEYHYDRNQFVPVASMPEFVEVRTEGRGWNMLRAIWARNPSVLTIDIPKPLSTLNIFPEKWAGSIKAMMPSVKVEAILTDSIFCRFDPIESREIPLFADLSDFQLKTGYRIIGQIKITPSTIRFNGAASLIRSLPAQLPVRISGNDVQENFDQNIGLTLPGEFSQNELLHHSPEAVNVHFSVKSNLEDELEIPVQILNQNLHPNLFLKEEKVVINYLVAIPDRAKIKPGDFNLCADFAKFNPGDSTVDLELQKWPERVSDAHPLQTKIRVYVK
jgi:YbbR domain-containing protein